MNDLLERLARSALPRVVFVSHAFGGGVGRHIEDLARALEGDAEILLVQPYRKSYLQLRWLRAGETRALWFHTAQDWERLIALLAAIGIARVHFHHVDGWPQAVLDLPARLGCPHDVTLHDFFPACPEYHFTDGDGRFCGAGAECHRCLEARPAQWVLSIDAWRALFAGVLGGAGRVIAPSEDAARRLRTFFPGIQPKVWPHIDAAHAMPPAPLRILVPGAISPEKGLGLLEACVRDAAARNLALHFRVLGYTARAIAVWPELPYSLSGEYPEGRLAELIALEHGDAFFFPAQCPETFSYTLSAALDTQLAIVATDLGALPERLARRDNARIVPWQASAAAVNDVFIEIARARQAAHAPRQAVDGADYRARYVEALPSSAKRPALPLPALEPRWLEDPREALHPWTLAALFDDAIGCGRGSSLEILRRMTREADAQLEAARARPAPQADVAPASDSPLRAFARLLKR